MATQHELQQSDDQFMAITDTMDNIAEVVENNGTDVMACINISPERIDAVIGGKFSDKDLSAVSDMIQEARNRLSMGETITGVLHCWR